MKIVEVKLNKEITWPNKCAICNQNASAYAYSNYRIIDGYYLVAIRETTHRVRYPICGKHKWVARFYAVVTNQSFTTGLVMAIAFPFLLSLPILFMNIVEPKFQGPIAVALYVGFTFAILYWKFRNPVKVMNVKKDIAKLRFRNEQYAEEFKKSNS